MKTLFSTATTLHDFLLPLDHDPLHKPALGSIDVNTTLHEAASVICSQSPLALETSASLLVTDEAGKPIGHLNVFKLIEALLAISTNQGALLDTLLATMSEATTVVDKDTTVVFWNNAAEKIYDLAKHEIVGTSLDAHFASDAIRLNDALTQGQSVQRVYHIPRPDSHVLINSAPIRHDGQIIGAISIEQDITELVRLHEELAHTTAHLHNLQQEMNRFQAADDPFFSIKGHSAAIQQAIQSAKKVAQTDATVLLYGESGVGKELFAQAIHQSSRRGDKPFIAINCAAIPAALFESELFGYQGGAFTGAERKGKPGKLELAHGGTLFLDEVGELPLELQVKLLRALQERQFYRVGGTEPITVNTRIISATNRHLEQMIAEGKFREDLFYRLNVFSLDIPPLRERKEDIPGLVQMFLTEYSAANEHPVPRVSPEVMQAMHDYSWPGNIRQLRNIIERLSILQEGGVILYDHLPLSMKSHIPPIMSRNTAHLNDHHAFHDTAHPIYDETQEQKRILNALDRTYGNKKAAAQLLGISRGTLYNKLRKYGLE
ncbi:sigma-54 interaction domain-containing protein [Brevibacillus ginsengisoli]|uniref:sigma-54 interaction domain-containing protein n=1 Tax=Brevibacillus ginsengisoli TaxID=363854 RepID=UPI003CF0BBED